MTEIFCNYCCSFSCENAGKEKSIKLPDGEESCFLKKPDLKKDFINFLKRNADKYGVDKSLVDKSYADFLSAVYKENL